MRDAAAVSRLPFRPCRLPDATTPARMPWGDVEQMPCERWDCGVPGLVASRLLGCSHAWGVAHDGSGMYVVADLASVWQAAIIARRLRGMADWTLPFPEVTEDWRRRGGGNAHAMVRFLVVRRRHMSRTLPRRPEYLRRIVRVHALLRQYIAAHGGVDGL